MNYRKKYLTSADLAGQCQCKIDEANRSQKSFYSYFDGSSFRGLSSITTNINAIDSMDDLLERDEQRVKDGFPKKIKIGQIVRPSKDGKNDKIIVVPTTEEDKLYHGDPVPMGESGGQGEVEEGDVLGEQEIEEESNSEQDDGAGDGDSGSHEIEKTSYDLGKVLTKKFELPNLQDKGEKKGIPEIIYELTDRNRGSGQILDKKATLREIVKTNIGLGRISSSRDVNSSELLISPSDRVFYILSEERHYKAQVIVFFLRDYSGSMYGAPAEAVSRVHLMIYSWLMYQYDKQVIPRFILHDTDAEEVPDFYTYYSSSVAGGTYVSSAYSLVNQIIDDENLIDKYNIYIFHGTDGDDWDESGEQTIAELENMMCVANRIGITVARNSYRPNKTLLEDNIEQSNLLIEDNILRVDSFSAEKSTEERLVKNIKRLIS